MREILFRGIHKKTGKFVYGDLYHLYSGDIYIQPQQSNVLRVIPETVGQFTGLKDKNGKEIFEGDICIYDDCIGAICFDEEDCKFIFKDGEPDITDFGFIWAQALEVIGNIHENPELLKD